MQKLELSGTSEHWLQSDEEIFWSGKASFSATVLAIALFGLFTLGCLIYFAITGVVLLALAFGATSELALLIPGVLFLASRGSRYYITDRRVVVLRGGQRQRSVSFEEIVRPVLARIRYLDVASLNIYHDKHAGTIWPPNVTLQHGHLYSPYNCLSLGLLRVAEAEEAEKVVLQAKYAKDRGLI